MTPLAAVAVDNHSAYESSALLGVSPSASSLAAILDAARFHYRAPVSQTSIEQRFEDLAATWHEETAVTSSATDLCLAHSYQRIIALGPPVVPYILRSFDRQPDHWHWALEVITGANPVSAEDSGNLRSMAAAWVAWGREAGLVR